jgi:hypothetical protein
MDFRLDKLRKALDSAVEGMSAEQLSWHPPGKWCASEVLEHLYLTYTGTIKGFEKVIASGKPQASLDLSGASHTDLGRGGIGPHARRTPSTCDDEAERTGGGESAKRTRGKDR